MRDVRSSARSPLEGFGLPPATSKSQSDVLNRLWLNGLDRADEALLAGSSEIFAGATRLTDEASLGRWQPMRGKRVGPYSSRQE